MQTSDRAASLEYMRLEILSRYQIIDSQTQAALDDFTKLAGNICQTPIATIAFVESDRQCYKSTLGTNLTEAPLEVGFCPLVVARRDNLIIPDTLADLQYATHPAVVQLGVRTYIGIPLITPEDYVLGTICVLDVVPREFTKEQIQGLELIRNLVMMQLKQMLVLRKALQTDRALVKVTQGIDAAIGKDFFSSLVKSLASALKVDYAYITELSADNLDIATTIALVARGEIVENIEYNVTATPCQKVIEQKKLCCYPSGVKSLFPEAQWLIQEGIESYVAIPLINSSGTILGLLGILDRQPLENTLLTESLLRIFATRTVSELERQKIEAVCQESEARLRFVLDSSEIGEWELDLTSVPYQARRSLKHDEIFGYNSLLPEWNYDIFLSYVHPGDRAVVGEKFQKTLTAYEDLNFEARIIRKDGNLGWIWARGSIYRDADGIPVRLLGLVIDISERKHSEAALRDSEWRLRQVVESNLFGVMFGDGFGKISYVNDYILNLLGYTSTDLQSEKLQWQQLTPPEFADLDTKAIKQLTKQGVCQPYEKVYLHKNGTRVPILIAAAMLEKPFNAELEAVAFLLDLTEVKRITEERDRFFNLSLDMLAIANFDGYFTHLNPSWEKTLGWSQQELMATPYLDLVHLEDREKTLVEVKKLAQGWETIQFENRYLHKNGSYRWLSWNAAPLPERTVIYAVAHDITDRKTTEQERERLLIYEQSAREAAEQANRIKDEFLAIVSHELRTPLNPILGWSKLLQQGRLNPTRTAEGIATIERNAKLQVQLIDDLLDISRILRGKFGLDVTVVDLSTVIAAAIETVHLAAEAKSLKIQVNYPPTAIAVNGDSGRLQQVVWNLLSNAVKFTPSGGSIEIDLDRVGDRAQIQVKDSGKGIDPNFLPYVFEHFRQEDGAISRKFGGLGLGLAIVRQITELHGGTVSVDSSGEGLGATFTVRIPLTTASVNSSITVSSPISVTDLKQIKILLVDDEPDSLELIGFALEQANGVITKVSSGVEALQEIARSVPDLVISDIGMAEMNGYMLIGHIRLLAPEKGGKVPAIALTAYAGEMDRNTAIAAGFQCHLPKPIDPDLLIATIIDLVG
jgi:PAS domain S-box-containing protein